MTVLRGDKWGEAIVNMMVEIKPGENLRIVAETGIGPKSANRA